MFQGGGGVQLENFENRFFEITVVPKGPSSGPIFWSGLERSHTHDAGVVATPIFLPKIYFFSKQHLNHNS